MTKDLSFPKENIKFVLLENIHQAAVAKLKAAGYGVSEIPRSLPEEELMDVIQDAHVLGIRSKTKVNAEHIRAARRLLAIGCFGVGTNQVDLEAAMVKGIPVFNAPYSSTRSVAELAIAYVLVLSRGIGHRNNKLHQGLWDKSAKGCHEVRHKTLGLIGYGHIGQQVGLMAENLGMRVIFYDKTKKLPLGNAKPVDDMYDLLRDSDFVSVHVPAAPGGQALLGEKELQSMKKGGSVINLSRGSVVELTALKSALETEHLAGAALDVFPVEPKTNKEEFRCEMTGVEKAVLTPHIGGSTEEAQENIGLEVATSFIKFIDGGTTNGAVNFPGVDLPEFPDSHRILNVHKNVPGVLNDVNKIIADMGANINSQYLSTYKDVGYLIVDLDKDISEEVKKRVEALPSNIRTRILY
jgi:D-3-phosphoglycerate dehydrogenase / 2-oxoglutarate reductase